MRNICQSQCQCLSNCGLGATGGPSVGSRGLMCRFSLRPELILAQGQRSTLTSKIYLWAVTQTVAHLTGEAGVNNQSSKSRHKSTACETNHIQTLTNLISAESHLRTDLLLSCIDYISLFLFYYLILDHYVTLFNWI